MRTIERELMHISTRDLARRSTTMLIPKTDVATISTRDLARRSTPMAPNQEVFLAHFNSQPLKEVDSISTQKVFYLSPLFVIITHIIFILHQYNSLFNSQSRKKINFLKHKCICNIKSRSCPDVFHLIFILFS